MTLIATRTDHDDVLQRIRVEIQRARRVLITSHLKPDGGGIAFIDAPEGYEVELIQNP